MPAQHLVEAPAPTPVVAIRIPVRMLGIVTLGLVAIVLVSLASWHVDDPSFSYASNQPARNLLGFAGAALADLAVQVFGLGTIAIVVPPALWGWAFIRRRVPTKMPLRLLSWVCASVLFCGFVSFFAVPESWPLPTGLGGLVGTGFTGLATMVTGASPQPVTAWLFAILIGLPTLALFFIALGLGRVQLPKVEPALAGKGKAASKKAAPTVNLNDERDMDGDGKPDRDSALDVILGAATHFAYSAQAAAKRAIAELQRRREAAMEAGFARAVATEPSLDGVGRSAPDIAPVRLGAEAGRSERRFTAANAAPLAPATPDFDAEEDDEPVTAREAQPMAAAETSPFDNDDDLYPPDIDVEPPHWEMQTPLRGPMATRANPRVAPQPVVTPVARQAAAPVAAAPISPRVAPPAPKVQPGQRQLREAQGSLLEDEDSGFELPPLSLLAAPKQKGASPEHAPERLEEMARKLESVLEDFGVKGDIINVRPGPVVTLFELEPAPGIKSSRVISLADDIARSMSAISARVAVVPGRNVIGIELPNAQRETVYLREMLASTDFEKMKGKLPICLGKTIGGEPIIADLAKMPHLLIAGTTGSGKSVGINTFILSLLYQMTPQQCRLIMVDPKMLELSIYDGIPHLLTPVVTDPHKAVTALKWAVREMEDRYRKMSKIGVRNIDGFNMRVGEAKAKGEVITRTVQTGFDHETGEPIFESEAFDLEALPYIVVIVDEMADLMMVAGKDIEGAIQRLAQMARAAGIHMITATQRPSVDVITGTIKANFPTRISFMVTSKIDSRTILGEQGAEQLLGNGDMLYMAGGGRIRRLHGPFVADGEVEAIVAHLKSQGSPDYLESITADEDEFDEDGPAAGGKGGGDEYGGSGDELYDKAVHVVLTDKKVSTSYIQRRLAIGYNKAATLIERMEREGVISAANHAGKREILVGNNSDGY
jgi:S-DNA-T family DNA segregation ATPase FtsK/SpoIIIE